MTNDDPYQQAQAYLFGRINFEKSQPIPDDLKLERMRALLAELGDPQFQIPAVHIAGTKGKGSTAVMAAAIFQAAGYRTALYTSPHLAQFEERMRVDGRMPSRDEVVRLVQRVQAAVRRLTRSAPQLEPTFFEALTAMAWLYFQESNSEIVVLEVGLGGRLDATNVCRPDVCLITSISRDHTALLGTSLGSIASEKAGILKPDVPLISGVAAPEARAVIRDAARALNCPSYELDREILLSESVEAAPEGDPSAPILWRTFDLETPWGKWSSLPVVLAGRHQVRNAAMAASAAALLRHQGWSIPESALATGLRRVVWPARIELVQRRPSIVLDAAHNWASVRALLETIASDFPSRFRTLVFGGTRDKDVLGLLRQLTPHFDRIVLTQYVGNPRALPVDALDRVFQAMTDRPAHRAATPAKAWELVRSLAREDELVVIAGSIFLAAEFRELLLNHPLRTDR